MDIDGLKADLRAEHKVEKLLSSSEERRLKIRKSEVINFRDQFRRFFKDIHHFGCPKDGEPLVASYESIVVVLEENAERNATEKGYKIFFILTSPDKKVHSIFADGSAYRFEDDKPDYKIPEKEINLTDAKFHEDFVKGKIFYKFKYCIEGDERVFDKLSGLLEVV